MALRSPAVRRLTCQSCRQSLLQSFIATIGGPVLPRPETTVSPRRTFASSTRWNNSRIVQSQTRDEDFPLNEISDEIYSQPDPASRPEVKPETSPDPNAETSPNPNSEPAHSPDSAISPPSNHSNSHLPWYLQSAPPIPTAPLSPRQALPSLPPSPPPLLSPLLDHLSIDLGMDDLTLLDLRSLDPPSALGPGLLMLLGTARSEKHLHVSADKLCRWLRTEHRLAPYADGLLGRNELKLKLKRRAKRSRLLSAVGARSTADSELEEGIRTGWVCVNVGRVEGGEIGVERAEEEKEEEGLEEGGVVGFGTQARGSSVVVQLMTEEKRVEVGLEGLWGTVLKRSGREGEAGSDGMREEAHV